MTVKYEKHNPSDKHKAGADLKSCIKLRKGTHISAAAPKGLPYIGKIVLLEVVEEREWRPSVRSFLLKQARSFDHPIISIIVTRTLSECCVVSIILMRR